PPHVVFVFATTEPNRIPETILSRVQRFDFRMLTEEEIFARLREIAGAEGIRAEEDALRLLARCAFGSMRDGQSILEQAAVLGDGAVTAALVEEMLGLVGLDAAVDLVRAVAADGAEAAFSRFSALLARGADLKFLFLSLVDVLRDAAVLLFTGNEELLYRHAPSSLARMKDLAALKSREEWMFLLDVAFRSEKDVLATEFPRLGFELLLLRLVNAPALLPVEALERGEAPAAKAGRGAPAVPPVPIPSASAAAPGPRTTHASRPAAPPARGAEGDLWEKVQQILRAKKKTLLLGLLFQMTGRREGNEFLVSCPHQLVLDRLRDEDKWPFLVQAVEEAAGGKLAVRLEAGEKKSPAADAEAMSGEALRKKALADPLLVDLLREFEGASLVEIRPAPRKAAAGGEREIPDEPSEEGDGEEQGGS
ncbi:MAG: hypothetical protein M1550_00105, partial [Deltaproteobacteria bacterium]|nr:hypothetical protein [Deltaproteobacteria bacterium]